MANEHDLIYRARDEGHRQLDHGLLTEAVKRTSYALHRRRHKFDSIVVRGVSGLLIGSPVALKTGIPLVIVRKPGENRHDSYSTIGEESIGTRCVFLDDFRCVGETEKQCRETVESLGAHITMCYFYARDGWSDPKVDPRWKEQEANRKALLTASVVQDSVVVDEMPIDWGAVDDIWSNVPTEPNPSTILGDVEYRELMRRSWAFEFKTTPLPLIPDVET
jgi:adenine/guanine phosphoribosyltransferase-like PRPP-binding protein